MFVTVDIYQNIKPLPANKQSNTCPYASSVGVVEDRSVLIWSQTLLLDLAILTP